MMYPLATVLVMVGLLLAEHRADACRSVEMECSTGDQCIPRSWRCDGISDCYDNSDEDNCDPCNSNPCQHQGRCGNRGRPTSSYTCSCPAEYTGINCETAVDPCNSRPCLNRATCYRTRGGYRCSCAAGYTGSRCQTRLTTTRSTTTEMSDTTCSSSQYRCRDGKCIRRSYLCDGDRDCSSGEDETLLLCRTTTTSRPTCPSTRYRCRDGKCIPRSYLCDGDRDCSSGEDETLPQCRPRTTASTGCSSIQYRCRSGKCIPRSYLCDGDRDCSGGEDESQCSTNTQCGVRTMGSLETMIINGDLAASGEFPWHAAIYVDDSYKCGGTLVGNRHIITGVSPCVKKKSSSGVLSFHSSSSVKVYLGSIKRTGADPKRKVYYAAALYASKGFTGKSPFLGDFGVIKLSRNVTYTSTIHGICLPSVDWPSANDSECYAVGFGLTQKPSVSLNLRSALYKLRMTIRNMSVCNRLYTGTGWRPDLQLCVESTRYGATNCYADNGGALCCRGSNNKWVIRGAYSLTVEDCVPAPNIYTNMFFFRETIIKLMTEDD